MEMFVTNDEVKQWECELPGLQGMELLPARLRLAWHLRQRDTSRALYLSDAAEQLLNIFSLLILIQILVAKNSGLCVPGWCW